MSNILVFGTGSGWQKIERKLNKKVIVLVYVDNDPQKFGKTYKERRIIAPAGIKEYKYDYILIAGQYYDEIIKQLLKLGVDENKIIPYYKPDSLFSSKLRFIINEKSIQVGLPDYYNELKKTYARLFTQEYYDRIKTLIKEHEQILPGDATIPLLKIYLCLRESGEKNKNLEELLLRELKNTGLCLKLGKNKHTKLEFKYESREAFTSVIIPVYRDAVGLKDTLTSLQKQTIKDYEIIVANDGADPEVSGVCREFNVKMVDIKVNSGSYYARNRAVEESTGEYLAFVDADIKIPEDWLKNGIKALRKAHYVAGNMIIDKKKIKSFGQFYYYKTAFPVENHMRFRQFGPTGNLFVKREVFENIGGFDQRIWSYADREFGERIYRFTKYRQLYKKDLTVVHPPRNYGGIIKKAKRIAKGKKDLRTFYPQRFYFPKKNFLALFWQVIFKRSYTINLFKNESLLCFWKAFFYCWSLGRVSLVYNNFIAGNRLPFYLIKKR